MSDLDQFPSLDDGPPKRSWAPAVPAAGAYSRNGRAFRFSVKTEDGVTHRFLLTRSALAWLALTFVSALSPWLSRPALWWYRRQARMGSQSARSSDSPIVDGSPHEGQSV